MIDFEAARLRRLRRWAHALGLEFVAASPAGLRLYSPDRRAFLRPDGRTGARGALTPAQVEAVLTARERAIRPA